MIDFKKPVSERMLFYLLLICIAILLVAIYSDYSSDMFYEFEYALAKSLGGIDGTLAVK